MTFKLSYSRLKSKQLDYWKPPFVLKFTHLRFCPQVLLSVDLERQPLGHFQFLNVSGRRRSESWESTGDCGRGGGCSWGTGRRPGRWQILHPLLRVEHALNLLLNLRRTRIRCEGAGSHLQIWKTLKGQKIDKAATKLEHLHVSLDKSSMGFNPCSFIM